MITLKLARTEKRDRDLKRRRAILKIGGQRFHLTPDEVLDLGEQSCRIYCSMFNIPKRLIRRRK